MCGGILLEALTCTKERVIDLCPLILLSTLRGQSVQEDFADNLSPLPTNGMVTSVGLDRTSYIGILTLPQSSLGLGQTNDLLWPPFQNGDLK